MAEVFKAKSYGVEGFEKIIAIKRILPTMGEDRDFIKMFIDEAKIAGQLAHANICQIFELGRIDGSHFIAMEYIWGKDLLQIQNRLRKIKQPMPIPMACFALAKVLEGLDYAHRKRDPLGRPLEIVHRDCSPQNVLVSYEGEVKVIDFGIAKATSRNSRTMAGVLKGKFGYMSPEQVRGLPLDRRSDIFALGTMLYECLTGDRLFQGETDFSTLEKVRNVDIVPPRQVNPAIPEAVEKVILKALAKDVDDRYQWCSEMLTDLQAYLMSQDVVYTAKTLSSWLKEIFLQEIERERQQLEQYKRVGRDGLIGGLPSAEADKDVVSQLGEAGLPEGDATTLGGPSFEDIEQAIANNAAPNVGERPSGRAKQRADSAADGDSGDFGEEAPTEIFGDSIDPALMPGAHPAPAATPAAGASATGRGPAVIPPQPKPAKPPAGRSPTASRPHDNPVGQAASPASGGSSPMPMPMRPNPASVPYGGQPAGNPYEQSATGTPAGMPAQDMSSGAANRTVLGMTAPSLPMGVQHGYPPPGQQAQQVQQPPQGYAQYPQYQGPGPYPSTSMPGYAPSHQHGYGGYPSGPMPAVTPVDQGMRPQGEGKRSTLVRDILIGVAIAAIVLGGFFIVKILFLDKKDNSATPTESTIATIHISMSSGTATLLVDDKSIATVTDGKDIPVNAGKRHVVLVGANGGKCEATVNLEAGKTTPLKCQLSTAPAAGSATTAPAAGSAGSAATPAPGAAVPTAAAPATTGAGSGAGSNAATAVTTTTPAPTAPTAPTAPRVPPSDKTVAVPTRPDVTAKKPEVKPTTTTTTPTAAATDTSKGYLVITSKPSAKILIDGADTGMSTPITGTRLPLAPGKHKMTFVMGDDRYTFPVTITGGKTERIDKDLQ
jgi:serine/threonine protein kinase